MTRDADFSLKSIGPLLQRPWPIHKTFYAAIVVGLAAPVLNRFLYRLFYWTIAPFVFFPLFALLIAWLYWLVDRTQFRRDWRSMVATFAAGLLWTTAAAGSGWCFSTHICMAGHMGHPPYPTWHWAADVGWTLALAVAAIWMRSVRASVCLAFAVLSVFIISYRFLFGSLGGMYVWLPL